MGFEDHSNSFTHYLDKQTGEVIMIINDYDFDEDETDELYGRIEEDPDRYLYIEPIESHEGFHIMEDFVATLPQTQEKLILQKALSWRKPFSNFKNALNEMGDIRQQWFDYHETSMRKYIQEWLEAEDLDFELK